MYYQRTLSAVVEKATKSFKVVMITGPRQVENPHCLTILSNQTGQK